MINNRLKEVSKYIEEYSNIADVGCDHGYLIKLAIEKKHINLAYAIDNKIEPLNCAKSNLKEYDNVKYFLSDGLDEVDESIDTVIICGMGGYLIRDIINKNTNKLSFIDKFIIEANKDNDLVRRILTDNGYIISNEEIINDKGKLYEIDVFKKSNEINKYSDKDILFGPILLNEKNDLFIKKWENKYNKIKDIKIYQTNKEKRYYLSLIKEALCK